MIEYRMFDSEDYEVIYSDFNKINNLILQSFPDSLKNKRELRKGIMAVYEINNERVTINYRENHTQVIVNSGGDSIKELFESKTPLVLEDVE